MASLLPMHHVLEQNEFLGGNKMKSLKCILSLCLTVSAVAHAQDAVPTPEKEHNNYPVNYDDCKVDIVQLKNSGGYLMSSDCKTVYILPPHKGASEISVSLNDGILNRLCDSYYMQLETFNIQNKILRDTYTRLQSLENNPRNAAEIARLNVEIEKLQKVVHSFNDIHKKDQGGSASVTVDARVTEKLLSDFLRLNRYAASEKGIQFKAMKTEGGYLALAAANSEPDANFPDLLKVNLNLIEAKSEIPDNKIYKMQSAASGNMILGLGKGCDLREKKLEAAKTGKSLSNLDLGNELMAMIAPTFSYSYNVRSSLSYKATIDFERAAKLLFENDQLKSQFRVSEFSKLLGEGKGGDAFEIDIDLGVMADRLTTPEAKESFLRPLIEDVRTRLAQQVVEQVNALEDVFEVQPQGAPLVVPEPGTREEFVRKENVCSSKSILGVRVSSSCHEQVITRRVNVDGTKESVIEKSRLLNVNVSETVRMDELLPARENVIF